jgi:hypothetical protein
MQKARIQFHIDGTSAQFWQNYHRRELALASTIFRLSEQARRDRGIQVSPLPVQNVSLNETPHLNQITVPPGGNADINIVHAWVEELKHGNKMPLAQFQAQIVRQVSLPAAVATA